MQSSPEAAIGLVVWHGVSAIRSALTAPERQTPRTWLFISDYELVSRPRIVVLWHSPLRGQSSLGQLNHTICAPTTSPSSFWIPKSVAFIYEQPHHADWARVRDLWDEEAQSLAMVYAEEAFSWDLLDAMVEWEAAEEKRVTRTNACCISEEGMHHQLRSKVCYREYERQRCLILLQTAQSRSIASTTASLWPHSAQVTTQSLTAPPVTPPSLPVSIPPLDSPPPPAASTIHRGQWVMDSDAHAVVLDKLMESSCALNEYMKNAHNSAAAQTLHDLTASVNAFGPIMEG